MKVDTYTDGGMFAHAPGEQRICFREHLNMYGKEIAIDF